MQQYEKVAFIVKNKGVKCEKSGENRLKSLKGQKSATQISPRNKFLRLTATIDAFTMRIKSKLFEQ